MSQTMHSLARRGAEVAHTYLTETSSKNGDGGISPMAGLVFTLTILVFMVMIIAISYTYGHLLPTLCMIESPETNAYVPVQTLSTEPPAYAEEDDGIPKTTEPDVLLIRNKPVTSSIRETILHLRARAGYWSRFRGLGPFIIWGFLRNLLIVALSLGSRNPLAVSGAAVLAEVALAHIHMTWIHIIISEPSEKRWYQRIPSLRGNWVKIAPAVLLWSIATQIVHILPMLICGTWGAVKQMQDPDFQPGKKHIYISAGQYFMAMLLTLIMFVLIQIPATVTMVRVAASMLPEEDETIVPFDRTYGGKVTPAIVGGQGKIGLVEAWKSFTWQSRKRLLLLCVKVAAVIVAFWILFSIVFVTEAHLMLGEKGLHKFMKSLHGMGRSH